MNGVFIDTNIFLRHLTGDHPEHSPAARALFEAIHQGRISGWTTETVITEIVWTLSGSIYHQTPRAIVDLLAPLVSLPGLHIPRKRLYGRVFELYATARIGFVDAYHAALIEQRGESELWSFDTDFDRIEGLRRLDPAVDLPV